MYRKYEKKEKRKKEGRKKGERKLGSCKYDTGKMFVPQFPWPPRRGHSRVEYLGTVGAYSSSQTTGWSDPWRPQFPLKVFPKGVSTLSLRTEPCHSGLSVSSYDLSPVSGEEARLARC